MINYRKHRWVPLALLLGWFVCLIGMSAIGMAGLNHFDEQWLRTVWIFIVAVAAFGLPFLTLRRLTKRLNRLR